MTTPHTLISFLGKGQAGAGGYRPATYDFGQGSTIPSSYFALSLLEHTKRAGPPVDTLVLLGTSGSMWDVFFLDQHDSDEGLDRLDALSEAVRTETVTQADVDHFAPHLSRRLGVTVIPRVIKHARDVADQSAILEDLAACVPERAPVLLDVTHGFRHLPMLGLVASRFLAHARNARVVEILYGALEMTPRDTTPALTPVLRLGGLGHLLSAVDALATFEKDGDYSVFAELAEAAGVAKGTVEALREASFYERTSNPRTARSKLMTVRRAMEGWDDPVLRLIRPMLETRTAWVRENSRDAWELAIGDRFRKRQDYLRAAAYWQEGLITRTVNAQGGNADTYEDREKARGELKSHTDFNRLSAVRNAMAHGIRHSDRPSRMDRWVESAMKTEKSLSDALDAIRKALV